MFTSSNTWEQVPNEWREPHGLHYAFAVRVALEQCKNIEEAVALWQRMPISSDGTFLAADPSGNAACIEIAGCKRAIKRIGPNTEEQYMVSTNHYTNMAFSNPEEHKPNAHSKRRYDVLSAWLKENWGQITSAGLKAFLDRDWFTGVSSYSSEFQGGTLWSMVFDVTAGTVEIRFGPPPHNGWYSFALVESVGVCEYTAMLPQ